MSALPPKADIARQLASADSTRSCAANATLTRLKSIRLLAELSEKRERSRFVELDAWALVVNAGNLQIESEIDRAVRAGIGIRLADSLSSSGSLERGHLKIYSVIPERIFVLPITEETNRSSNGSAPDNLRPISRPLVMTGRVKRRLASTPAWTSGPLFCWRQVVGNAATARL